VSCGPVSCGQYLCALLCLLPLGAQQSHYVALCVLNYGVAALLLRTQLPACVCPRPALFCCRVQVQLTERDSRKQVCCKSDGKWILLPSRSPCSSMCELCTNTLTRAAAAAATLLALPCRWLCRSAVCGSRHHSQARPGQNLHHQHHHPTSCGSHVSPLRSSQARTQGGPAGTQAFVPRHQPSSRHASHGPQHSMA
jgi:hypothetical protein